MVTTEGKCPIWGLDCSFSQSNPFSRNIDLVEGSLRAGGDYEITYMARHEVMNLDDQGKARVTSILVDQWMKGVAVPRLSKEDVQRARDRQPLPVHERAERLLSFLVRSSSNEIGQPLHIGESEPRLFQPALGWSESTKVQELYFLSDYLKNLGCIEKREFSGYMFDAVVEVPGYRRVEELQTNRDSAQCFVAMWFDDSMNDARDRGIIPAIEDAGYTPSIINQKPNLIGRIEDAIIAEIRRSRFVVADFTHGEDGVRGSVYYEAGFAHAMGLPVIFTRRKDKEGVVHFDTDHFYRIEWETSDDLREQLQVKIEAAIGEGPNKNRKD